MKIGFLSLPSDSKLILKMHEPVLWDRQTLLFICDGIAIKDMVKDSITRKYKPTSHSEGYGYCIDVYTNLNYSIHETDPAMRNIRCVYCDSNIMNMQAIYDRFPNSYMIKVERRDGNDACRISREVPEIPCH